LGTTISAENRAELNILTTTIMNASVTSSIWVLFTVLALQPQGSRCETTHFDKDAVCGCARALPLSVHFDILWPDSASKKATSHVRTFVTRRTRLRQREGVGVGVVQAFCKQCRQ
jgi:hypothetical protein